MIYLIGSLAGFANGFFTSGAGQIIIFYLVFIKKYDTKKSRGTSIAILSLTSLISLISFIFTTKIEIKKAICVFVISIIFGVLGSISMKKANSNFLNLFSGILMTVLSVINIFLK